MSERNPSIWRSEDEFKDTEIGRIPKEWGVGKLEAITEVLTDGSHFSPKELPNGDRIIGTVKDMEYDHFSFENCKRISQEDFDFMSGSGCSPKRGDLLISKDGAKCLDIIFVYDQPEEIVVLSSIAIARLKPEFFPQYYRYFLLSPNAQTLMKNGYVSGSAIPRVILKDFKAVPVPLPPLPEQKAIAHILSILDEKIELNKQMNKTLEEIGKAIFKHWFVDFEFPDEEGKPYKSNGGEMVFNEELGKKIPKGWEIQCFSNIAEVTDFVANGSFAFLREYVKYSYDGGYAIVIRTLDNSNKFEKDFVYVDKRAYKFLNKSKLYGGEIIISNVGDIGTVFRVPHLNRPMTLGPNALLVLGKEYNEYIHQWLISHVGQGSVLSIRTGSAQPKFNKTDFRNLNLIIPNIELIHRFNIIIQHSRNQYVSNDQQKINIQTLREQLLPKLISGRIRVNVEEFT